MSAGLKLFVDIQQVAELVHLELVIQQLESVLLLVQILVQVWVMSVELFVVFLALRVVIL